MTEEITRLPGVSIQEVDAWRWENVVWKIQAAALEALDTTKSNILWKVSVFLAGTSWNWLGLENVEYMRIPSSPQLTVLITHPNIKDKAMAFLDIFDHNGNSTTVWKDGVRIPLDLEKFSRHPDVNLENLQTIWSHRKNSIKYKLSDSTEYKFYKQTQEND